MSTVFADHMLGPDTHANRPAANAVPTGTLYSCTDHVKIYKSDGASWADYADIGGTGIPESIVNAKGDLIVGTAADTAGILTAGTDGKFLEAWAAATEGVRYAWAGGIVRAIALKTADQSVNTATNTAVTWTGADVYDPDGFHDPASNSSRFTIPTGFGGANKFFYLVGFMIWDTNATNMRQLAVSHSVDGTSWIKNKGVPAGGAFVYQDFCSLPIQCDDGEYIELVARQDSGATRTLTASAQNVRAALIEVRG